MKPTAVELRNMKAKDMMHTDVVVANGDMTIAELAELLQTHGVTGGPVVTSKGKVVGVVSETDIVAAETQKTPEEKEAPHYFRAGGTIAEVREEAGQEKPENSKVGRFADDSSD